MKKTPQRLLLIIALMLFSTVKAQDYISPLMINIPLGNFMMRSEKGNDSSKPTHSVPVIVFQMAKYPVTVTEFRKFVKATNYKSTTGKCPDFIDRNWYSDPGKKATVLGKNIYLATAIISPLLAFLFKMLTHILHG